MKIVAVFIFVVLVGCVSNKPVLESEASFGTAIGRVLLLNGEPVHSRIVNLLHLIERGENDPFYPYVKIKFEIVATTVTDRNGRFIFERVRSGRYSVTAKEIQGGMFQVSVDSSMSVLAGKVTDFGDMSVLTE